MKETVITPLVRHGASVLAAWLVQHGLLAKDSSEAVIGSIIVLAMLAWSIIEKRMKARDPGAPGTNPVPPAVGLALLLMAPGCAVIKQEVITDEVSTNGVHTVRTTRSKMYSLFEAKVAADKVRASNGKTQSIGVSEGSAEATSTNIVKVLDGLSGMIREAAGAVK